MNFKIPWMIKCDLVNHDAYTELSGLFDDDDDDDVTTAKRKREEVEEEEQDVAD